VPVLNGGKGIVAVVVEDEDDEDDAAAAAAAAGFRDAGGDRDAGARCAKELGEPITPAAAAAR
jgi:hypothetical protein